jgi:[ribosomal protein S5]-alanine N-acetyltransferase
MSQDLEALSIELLQLHPLQLQQLCNREPVEWAQMRVPDGAMPSQKAIVRALNQWQASIPPKWCLPYLIVTPTRDVAVGACGFKGSPVEATVEIYYGIAPSFRGKGIASQALRQLLEMAVTNDEVERVIAHILPRNIPSRRLVMRMGFKLERRFLDTDGEDVDEWCWTLK